jgi:hypothetical protein
MELSNDEKELIIKIRDKNLEKKEKNNIYMKEWSKRPENRERVKEGKRNEYQQFNRRRTPKKKR